MGCGDQLALSSSLLLLESLQLGVEHGPDARLGLLYGMHLHRA